MIPSTAFLGIMFLFASSLGFFVHPTLPFPFRYPNPAYVIVAPGSLSYWRARPGATLHPGFCALAHPGFSHVDYHGNIIHLFPAFFLSQNDQQIKSCTRGESLPPFKDFR